MKYDKGGDQHYDVASALIKSIRGSDVDAALHYLARMIEAGEDPRFIARRLIISASEDIGLADPTALPTAVAAAQAVALIGFPEAALTLSHATIALALAPKSNSATTAIAAAMEDVRKGLAGPVPPHLRDGHYKGAAKLGARAGLCLSARRAGRDRRPAVRPGRRGGPALLRAHALRGRGAVRGRGGEGARAAPAGRGLTPAAGRGVPCRAAMSVWIATPGPRSRVPGAGRRATGAAVPRRRVAARGSPRGAPDGSSAGRGLEEPAHERAQPVMSAHRLGEVEARVEGVAVVRVNRTRSPNRSSASGVARCHTLAPHEPAHSSPHLLAVGGGEVLEQLGLVAYAADRVRPRAKLLGVHGARAPQVVHDGFADLQAERHAAGPRLAGHRGQPAGDPGPAPDTVGDGDRSHVRDLQHGPDLVVLRRVAARTAGESAGRTRKTSPSGPTLADVGDELLGTGRREARYEERRRAGTMYESSCALGC